MEMQVSMFKISGMAQVPVLLGEYRKEGGGGSIPEKRKPKWKKAKADITLLQDR